MITNAQPLACGNCGNGTFEIFWKDRPDGLDGFTALLVECRKCKNITVLQPGEPYLKTEWSPDAEGILCTMEPSHKV